MYGGHIIIQGCQLWPFEGNKYLQLHTFHHLNFVWTHGCNECHSPSFIHLASPRSRHFIQIRTTEREKSRWWSLVPSLACLGSCTHYREGWKLYLRTRMMDDKWNLCPGTEGEVWQRYLSWEWGLGSGEAGRLKAQDPQEPQPGPFPRHLPSDPHHSCSLMRCARHPSRVFFILLWLILRHVCSGSLSNCRILGRWINLVFQSSE